MRGRQSIPPQQPHIFAYAFSDSFDKGGNLTEPGSVS
jgi:hypothetical protein